MKRKQVYKVHTANDLYLGIFPMIINGDVIIGKHNYLTVDNPHITYSYKLSSKEETDLYYKIHLSEKIKEYC